MMDFRRALICKLVLVLTLLVAACSHQNRSSNPQLSSADLLAMLADAQSGENNGDSGAALAQAIILSQDHQNTTIYFADAPGPMGTVASIMALKSYAFFLPESAQQNGPIREVRVFFLEHAGDHQAVLILGIIQQSSSKSTANTPFTYYSFQGQGTIDKGIYSLTFTGADGNPVTLRSKDVKGDDLKGNIQLQVFVTQNAQESRIGKFSILAGYR